MTSVVAKAERGQPAFGQYLKETRIKLGLSLRRVEALTDGRVRNAFLSQIENGQVALPNIGLLGELAQVYGLDYWNLMWRAGYDMPERPPSDVGRRDPGEPPPWALLEDLTAEELQEVLWYAEAIRQRRSERSRSARR